MAGEQTYFNPDAARPAPVRGLEGMSGLNYMRDRETYTKNMLLQQFMQEMTAKKQQEDLMQGAGVRNSQRGQQGAEADLAAMLARAKGASPGYGNAMVGGAIGGAQ